MELRRVFAGTFGLLAALFLTAAPGGAIDLTVRPSVVVPVGDSANWFKAGGGLGIQWALPLGASDGRLTLTDEVLGIGDQALSGIIVMGLAPGLSYEFSVAPAWALGLEVGVGAFGASRADFSVASTGLWLSSGITVRWILEPTLAFRGSLGYQKALGLYQVMDLWLGFELEDLP